VARVLVAMSGGVDSSVAAALCAEAGHDALGVTLRLSGASSPGRGCCGSSADACDARRVAEKIGIPHRLMDMAELFERAVVGPFVSDYLSQRTPNPCVECNRKVKFGALLELADSWKAGVLATGHYARVRRKEDGAYGLYRAADVRKDQSYFLYCLTQRELSRSLFPLGEMTKGEVRAKARALGLPTAEKPESMEICFVPGNDYRAFLRAKLREADDAFAPGDIRDASGRRLGRHKGLLSYTVGQRRGLGIGAAEPLYVSRLDGATNTLVVETAKYARRRSFIVGGVSWTRQAQAGEGGAPGSAEVLVRVRHRGRLCAAGLSALGEDRIRVDLRGGERGIAPGQAAVFYDRQGDEVLGGGAIEEVP